MKASYILEIPESEHEVKLLRKPFITSNEDVTFYELENPTDIIESAHENVTVPLFSDVPLSSHEGSAKFTMKSAIVFLFLHHIKTEVQYISIISDKLKSLRELHLGNSSIRICRVD